MGEDLPPYLQFPSWIPVDGQIISNPKNTVAFYVHYDPFERCLSFDGRRAASKPERILIGIDAIKDALASLEEMLMSLIVDTP